MLLLPDLINFFLTGKAVAEYTNATTTQMVNAATGSWDRDLLEKLGRDGWQRLSDMEQQQLITAATALPRIGPGFGHSLPQSSGKDGMPLAAKPFSFTD